MELLHVVTSKDCGDSAGLVDFRRVVKDMNAVFEQMRDGSNPWTQNILYYTISAINFVKGMRLIGLTSLTSGVSGEALAGVTRELGVIFIPGVFSGTISPGLCL